MNYRYDMISMVTSVKGFFQAIPQYAGTVEKVTIEIAAMGVVKGRSVNIRKELCRQLRLCALPNNGNVVLVLREPFFMKGMAGDDFDPWRWVPSIVLTGV